MSHNFQIGGNLQFGITNTQNVTHNDLLPGNCGLLNLGSDDYRYNRLYVDTATSVAACDVAEWFEGEAGEPGTVYSISPDGGLIQSRTENDPHVIGVYSTQPGLEMGDIAHKLKLSPEEWRSFNVLLGLSGSMPVKVQGHVKSGDYLITSDEVGCARAIRHTDYLPLFVIGRAVEDSDESFVKFLCDNQVLYHNPATEEVGS
ncbi:hypothetical protein ES703_119739 [subsurface metagenome]